MTSLLKTQKDINIDAELERFLDKNTVGQKHDYSHVSLFPKKCKYNIFTTAEKINKFWDYYCTHVSTKNSFFGIAEKTRSPEEGMAVIVDVDLSVNFSKDQINNLDNPLYSEKQVISLIKIYQDVLKEILLIQNNQQHILDCVFFSKKPYFNEEQNKKKHGFHLQFPKLYMTKGDQIDFLFPRVQEIVQAENLFSIDSIDKNVYNVPWLLYKSRKSAIHEPYLINKIFNFQQKQIFLKDLLSNHIFKDASFQSYILDPSLYEFELPRFFSIIDNTRDLHYVHEHIKEKRQQEITQEIYEKKEKLDSLLYGKDFKEEDLEKIEQLVNILDEKRSNDRFEWLKVGWILKWISFEGTFSNSQLFEIWKKFSQKCIEKYDEKICETEWERMRPFEKGYTLGTLHYMAKTDNEEQYNIICEKSTIENVLMVDAARFVLDHSKLLQLLHIWFKNTIVFAGSKWYVFMKDKKNSGWETYEENSHFYNLFDSDIIPKYQKLQKYLKDQNQDGSNDESIEAVSKFLVKNLGNYGYREVIIKAAKNKFCDESILDKIDQNQFKIRFANGTYDLNEHKLYNGTPEDYLSKKLPIEYIDYSNAPQSIKNIEEFLDQIFPKPEIKAYFLNMYCSIFVGKNIHKNILFWTGSGDNGKSIMQHLFEKMLGKLSVKIETTIFTGKKSNIGTPIPELSRAKPPVRFLMMEEPDSYETFQIGVLKRITGSDAIIARDLYQKGSEIREYIPTFKIALICNMIPKVEMSDQAFWNRVKIIPFLAVFLDEDNPLLPKSLKEQKAKFLFKKDRHFDQKLNSLAPIFAWYLINWFKIKCPLNTNFVEPTDVKIATENFKNSNDIIFRFIQDCIEFNDEGQLSADAAYLHFQQWYKDEGIKTIKPSRDAFKNYCVKFFNVEDKSCKIWCGIRLFKEKEEINEEQSLI